MRRSWRLGTSTPRASTTREDENLSREQGPVDNNIDEYVGNLTIINQQTDATSHTLRVAVRADINETAVDAILDLTSVDRIEGTGNGDTLVFVFLAREVIKSKSFDARVSKVAKIDSSSTSMQKAVDSDDVEAAGSRSSDLKEVTYGGSVERKRAQTVYDVTIPRMSPPP